MKNICSTRTAIILFFTCTALLYFTLYKSIHLFNLKDDLNKIIGSLFFYTTNSFVLKLLYFNLIFEDQTEINSIIGRTFRSDETLALELTRRNIFDDLLLVSHIVESQASALEYEGRNNQKQLRRAKNFRKLFRERIK